MLTFFPWAPSPELGASAAGALLSAPLSPVARSAVGVAAVSPVVPTTAAADMGCQVAL